MSWIFDVLQVLMALCAIPIYKILASEVIVHDRLRSRGTVLSSIGDVLMYFAIAMALDFLGSLPGLGVGTKSAFGQDVLEPLSHLAIVGALLLGLWSIRQISGTVIWFLAVAGLIGFAFAHGGSTDVITGLGNGLLPALNWLVIALCLVNVVCLYTTDPKGRFNLLLVFGVFALAAATAQHELIAQWAQGEPHYPELK